MHSATNLKMANKEDRALLYAVFYLSRLSSSTLGVLVGQGYILWPMSIAWDVTIGWDGITSKLRITLRDIKKVPWFLPIWSFCATNLIPWTGKYMLEREKLVKENNWEPEGH
jgi:hypothetical protein